MSEKIRLILILAITLWNLIVLILYFADKCKAKAGAWRIPEKTLITSAILFGGIGAGLGMKLFRHKTKHIQFKIAAVVGIIITVAAYIFLIFNLDKLL